MRPTKPRPASAFVTILLFPPLMFFTHPSRLAKHLCISVNSLVPCHSPDLTTSTADKPPFQSRQTLGLPCSPEARPISRKTRRKNGIALKSCRQQSLQYAPLCNHAAIFSVPAATWKRSVEEAEGPNRGVFPIV